MAMSKCDFREVGVQVEASPGSYSRDERDKGEGELILCCKIY
jgi:hypothetical protein